MSANDHIREKPSRQGLITELWNSFWLAPDANCPKCGCEATEYYDPFFFSPFRTLKGMRRIKCTSCHFIWRPSRRHRSVWDRFKSGG